MLPSSLAHYVMHVLRLRVGDEIAAFDGTGQECLLRLSQVTATQVWGEPLTWLPHVSPAAHPCVLGQAYPKGTKMDVIVEKCSELGLTTLVPLYTARTVVREVPARMAGKLARWQRIAAAAARQCGRQTLLEVQPPLGLTAFCAHYASAPVKILCWEEERQHSVRQVLSSLDGQSPIVLIIGPEGGLTVAEVELARSYGFRTVSLGPHLLRTETAAIVLTSIVRYSVGALEPNRET